MKQVMVGFTARRGEDGSFFDERPIMREIPDRRIGESGQPKVLEKKLDEAAERIFAPMFAEKRSREASE